MTVCDMFSWPFRYLALLGTAITLLVPSHDLTAQKGVLHIDTLSASHLIALFNPDSLSEPDTAGIRFAAQHELIRRRPYGVLFHAFVAPQPWPFQQEWVARIIDSIRTPVTDSAMASLATADTDLTAYYAVRYSAEVGNTVSLAILAKNFWMYRLFPLQLEDLIPIFGRFRYGPAAPRLAEAMRELNMGVVDEAQRALLAIYPEVNSTPTDYSQAGAFWQRYVTDHPRTR